MGLWRFLLSKHTSHRFIVTLEKYSILSGKSKEQEESTFLPLLYIACIQRQTKGPPTQLVPEIVFLKPKAAVEISTTIDQPTICLCLYNTWFCHLYMCPICLMPIHTRFLDFSPLSNLYIKPTGTNYISKNTKKLSSFKLSSFFICVFSYCNGSLVQKIDKLYSKLENFHHRHESQALSSSLEAFQTLVSNSLNRLFSSSKSAESQVPSFPWMPQCFELIPIINNGFAKLVVAIDYPMTKWEADSVEEYLNYTLKLLDLCNSITVSLSHLGKERMSLSHGLSLVESSSSPSLAVEHLRPILVQPNLKSLSKDIRFQGNEEHGKERFSISKKSITHQALVVMEGMVFWLCGILMSGLVGDSKPYLEMRKSGGRLVSSLICGLDLSVGEVIVENKGMLKEVIEINDSVAAIASAIGIGKESKREADELQRQLEVFEKVVEDLGKEVDCVFNQVLAGRNQLLNGFQHQKQ